MPTPHKLVVVGTGHVGSYVLADAMKLDLFGTIVTIDADNNVARGEALDQHHATGLTSIASADVRSGGYEECADADVIIVAAGGSVLGDPDNPDHQPDRAGLARVNGDVTRDVMGKIAEQTTDAVVIFITNPLDTVVWIAENEFNYQAGKVFGTGTMLDSARLRRIVADRAGVSPSVVTGYMMGEHGMTAFPVLSHLSVGGVAAGEVPAQFGVSALEPTELAEAVVTSAYDVLNSKGWTNAGVAQSAVAMARAVLLDEKAIYPACSTLRGEYGHDGDVTLSVPSIIGAGGVEKRLEVSLNHWETEALELSVEAIREALRVAGAI